MFKAASWPTKILGVSFFVILAYLPFHALVSTWLIRTFGNAVFFKSTKEILLFGILLPLSAYVVFREPAILVNIWKRAINKLIFAYVALQLVLVFALQGAAKSEIAGLVFNTRFLAMFLLAQVLVSKLPQKQLQELSLRFIFWGGAVVVAFGALQVLVLPNDFLRHFGYAKDIIPPYFTVDNNENYVRILSTLRGPNALGAYLVFWLPILLLVTKRMWNVAAKYRVLAVLFWLAGLTTLYGTGSRSAWIGSVVSVGAASLLLVSRQVRAKILLGGVVAVAICALMIGLNWSSSFVQTSLWHNDPAEQSNVNSDNQRQDSLIDSLRIIKANPFGSGVGSVNIASTYGPKPITVENYYLQIAQELGLLGLAIFIGILVLVALSLWRQRALDIASALFASMLGLSIVGMLLPVWGDETVSMLWWAMAGISAFATIKKPRRKNDAVKS